MASLFQKGKTYRKAKVSKRPTGAPRKTPKALRYAVVALCILLLVLPPLVLAHPISYMPLFMALLMTGLSWVYLRVVSKNVSASISESAFSCDRGRDAGFAVSLSNTSFLPVSRVELRFSMSDINGEADEERVVSCSLAPYQTVDAVLDARFTHLGKYQAGVRSLVVYDLLGLFYRTHENGSMNHVLVNPLPVRMAGVTAAEAAPDESTHMLKPIASDNEDYSSVREYTLGDPLKAVHWNLSSRNPNGAMFTRLFEEYVNPALAIIIDCYAPDYDRETMMSLFDGVVECAVALCNQSQASGIDAEIRFVNADGEMDVARLTAQDNVSDLIDALHPLANERTTTDDTSQIVELLKVAGLQNHGFGNVAFVTSRMDEDCLGVMNSIRMRRRNTTVFAAVPRDLEGKEREKFLAPLVSLETAGTVCYAIESNELGTEVMGV